MTLAIMQTLVQLIVFKSPRTSMIKYVQIVTLRLLLLNCDIHQVPFNIKSRLRYIVKFQNVCLLLLTDWTTADSMFFHSRIFLLPGNVSVGIYVWTFMRSSLSMLVRGFMHDGKSCQPIPFSKSFHSSFAKEEVVGVIVPSSYDVKNVKWRTHSR